MSEKEYAKIIARNLRNIAFNAGKTQADISRDLQINKATVSSWMNGTRIPRMDKIDLLCHYFNVTRSAIMEAGDGSDESYYMDPDSRDLAQFLYDDPEYKVLFDACRKIKKEDIQFVKEMIERITRNE